MSFAGENTAYLRYDGDGKLQLDIASGNSTDTFTATVSYTAAGQAVNDETLDGVKAHKAGTIDLSAINTKADVDKSLQVKVVNDGTGEVFYSNAVTVKKAK